MDPECRGTAVIFVNYRREDSGPVVAHLRSKLVERYGDDAVYVDDHSNELGARWPEAIRSRLVASTVLLAIIGRNWTCQFTGGPFASLPRLCDPADWVRREICMALDQSTTRVIVVLIDDAALPETRWGCQLDQLGELQHARLRTGRTFDADIADLVGRMEKQVPALRPATSPQVRVPAAGPDARLRRLLDAVELRDREVVIGGVAVPDAAVSSTWRDAVRARVAELTAEGADEALRLLIPGPATPAREARPRAVLALDCVLDRASLGDATVTAVLDAAIDHLLDIDCTGRESKTSMDDVLSAAHASVYGGRLRQRLLERFIASRGDLRRRIGSCIAHPFATNPQGLAADTSRTIIAVAARGLASDHVVQRIDTALQLVYAFHRNDGLLGFLSTDQRDTLVGALLSAAARDEASLSAAVWALSWLTGARTRLSTRGDTGQANPEMVRLERSAAHALETLLQRPGLDANSVADGALVLNREIGITPVGLQHDWIHALAKIADGVLARRDLSPPGATGRQRPTEWLEQAIRRAPTRAGARIAQALGAMGVFVPEMVSPLRELFAGSWRNIHLLDRDEAVVYLALIGGPEVVKLLVTAADTSPDVDEYRRSRGVFGLLLLDSVDVLAEQLRKPLPQGSLDAYAFGLAGSCDRRGRALLLQLGQHPSPSTRAAVTKALTREALQPQ